jgi:hypothetical protein
MWIALCLGMLTCPKVLSGGVLPDWLDDADPRVFGHVDMPKGAWFRQQLRHQNHHGHTQICKYDNEQ